MNIYDISQEVFSCQVFPDDPAPEKEQICSMENGDLYNLTMFSMCAHNGTHVDAPSHFIHNGKTLDQIGLEPFVGMAYVAEHNGVVTAENAQAILTAANAQDPEAAKRILIKGSAEVSQEAAQVFADAKLLLVGNESQTVGPEDAPMAVHLVLLGAGVALLEGIRLSHVPEGTYLLNAAPLNLGGAEGAPCRAILIKQEDTAAVSRIRQMESYFDRLHAAFHNTPERLKTDPTLRSMLRALTDYYENGQWLEDYDRDARGELPASLKRGVLSQDGLYDLLDQMEHMKRSYFLTTSRIGFSKWTSEDLHLAQLLWGDPEVTRYICATGVFSREDIAARLAKEIENDANFGVQYWPIFELSTGRLIGCCGLRPYKESMYEIGFHLRPDFWRKGFAVEAASAAILYAFNILRAEGLFAGHNPNNVASQKVLTKLKFQYIGDEFYAPTGLYHPSYQRLKPSR